MSSYDVLVLGTGPGGYVCALKAAQLGLRVGVIERRPTHGGTCLNVGCIPSKALLHASELFAQAGHDFSALGIEIEKPRLNLPNMMRHKEKCIRANVGGIEFLLKKNGIDSFQGHGQILESGRVRVAHSDGRSVEVTARALVIATGSEPSPLPGLSVAVDERVILTSTGALALDSVPEKMVVVGAGVIGLELGSVWSRLGSAVTVVEFSDRILGSMDLDVATKFQKILEKQGITLRLGTKVTGITHKESGVEVTCVSVKGGESASFDADCILIATGRRPFTQGLGLESVGIVCDSSGRIPVDASFQTSVPGIYAIGDVIKGPMLAHKASEEGIALAEILAGQAGHVNYGVIPSVVYTFPELASVGQTEEELKKAGIPYCVGNFPFSANGRAKAMQATEGFVKIFGHRDTDRVLGVHIVGPCAGELIHEAAVLMEFGGSCEDLARICHAHPTLSEAVREAALDVFFKPLHM